MVTMHPCEQVGLDFIDTAPARFRNTVSLRLTPDEAFDVLARADLWSRWVGIIKDVNYTSPEPHGVGATRTVTMVAGIVADEEFLAWEHGKHLAFRFNAVSTSALAAFSEDYRITETANGCDLTWSLGQRLGGPSKAIAPLTGPATNFAFRRFLARLAKLTANGVPAPA